MERRPTRIIQCIVAMVLTFPAALAAAPPLIISEFMALNRNGLRDEDGDRSDWIELHNPSPNPVSLADVALTDEPADPLRWKLPPGTLPPGGFLVIFASGKNRTPPSGPWHASFRLAAEGEYLGLTWQGITLSEFTPAFPPQLPDVSFGPLPDSTSPQFMTQPSPGLPNVPSPPVSPVTLSPPSGIFTGVMQVNLATGAADATIWYTTDGSLPVPGEALQYHGPIELTASTRLRAVAASGGFTSAVTAAAWIRLSPDLAAWQSPLPILLIENFGQGTVPSKGWSSNGAGVRQVPQQEAAWLLFERNGATASPSSPPQLAGFIGIRGRGAISTTWAQKPYHVQPRDPAGVKTDAGPLGLPANDEFALYYPDPTGGDFRDPTMLFNTFAYELSRTLGRWAPRFRFTEVFLNEDGGAMTSADRRGVYALLEKVSRGDARLPFDRLSMDGQRGGALLSINRMDPEPETGWPSPNGAMSPQFFHTAGPDGLLQTAANTQPVKGDDLPSWAQAFLNFDQPSGDTISSTQRNALEGWFRSFETTLYNDASWLHPTRGYRSWLDSTDWVQGYLLQNLIRHSDALRLSLYPWLGNDRRLRMGPLWDVNFGGYFVQGTAAAAPWYRREQLWFPRLFADPDFLQQYTDQWAAWRSSSLSDAAMARIIEAQAAEITTAKAVAQGVPSPDEWSARLTSMKQWLRTRTAFLDQQFLPAPQIQPNGGSVPAGTTFEVLTTADSASWRPDGDPRASGGAPAPDSSSAPAGQIQRDTRIMARSRTGAAWSAPTGAVFVTDAANPAPGDLVISEIHYHPSTPSPSENPDGRRNADDFEFIEILNLSPAKVSLLACDLRGAATYSFRNGDQWSLEPGARLVVAASKAAFAARYGPGFGVAGEFSGPLPDHGGSLHLMSPSLVIDSLAWNDRAPWPAAADGRGYSLTRINVRESESGSSPEAWRTSTFVGGSPAGDDAIAFSGDNAEAWSAYALPWAQTLRMNATPEGWNLAIQVPPGHDDASWKPESAATTAGPWQGPGEWLYAGETRTGDGSRFLHWSSTRALHFQRIRASRR
jgi:hypothetical protein